METADKTQIVARLTPAGGVPTTVEAKVGTSTSEWKALLVTFALAALEELATWATEGGQPDRTPWGVVAAALAAGLYAIGRSIVKRPITK